MIDMANKVQRKDNGEPHVPQGYVAIGASHRLVRGTTVAAIVGEGEWERWEFGVVASDDDTGRVELFGVGMRRAYERSAIVAAKATTSQDAQSHTGGSDHTPHTQS